MFGGWAWLLRGNLVCGAREDGLLARLGKGSRRLGAGARRDRAR